MTGDISRAITLTTYGTAFLRDNYDISHLTLDHPSFTFTNRIEFLYFETHFFKKPTWHVYAADPISWLGKLKKDGCTELRLVFEPDNSTSLDGAPVPDYKLAGFVGGGGNRYIQTVFEKKSDLWQAREEVTEPDSPERKIWTVSYGRTVVAQPAPIKVEYDIDSIRERLRTILTEIRSLAIEANEMMWANWFGSALTLIDSPSPYTTDSDKLIVPTEKFPLKTLQLLAASGKAWCFGGMGSWNDVGFTETDLQLRYERLSAELYEVINESYLAVANSV